MMRGRLGNLRLGGLRLGGLRLGNLRLGGLRLGGLETSSWGLLLAVFSWRSSLGSLPLAVFVLEPRTGCPGI